MIYLIIYLTGILLIIGYVVGAITHSDDSVTVYGDVITICIVTLLSWIGIILFIIECNNKYEPLGTVITFVLKAFPDNLLEKQIHKDPFK